MLTGIHIRRIRSVLHEHVPLRPLTVLVGPNGAGKSNIVRGVFISSLLCRALLDRRPAAIRKVEYLDIEPPIDRAEIYAYSSVPEVRLEVSLGTFGGNPTLDRDLRALGFKVKEAERSPRPSREIGNVRMDYSPERKTSYVRFQVTPKGGKDPRSLLDPISKIRYISTDRLGRWDIDADLLESRPQEARDLLSAWFTTRADFNVADLGRGWGATSWRELIRGRKGIIPSLTNIKQSKGKSEIFVRMGKTLFGMDWTSMLARPEEMEFTDEAIGPRGVTLPFRLGSLGTRQFFPILVHSLAMGSGGILVTEEPEISLHPAAQAAIGEYLAEATRRRVQIIISTHSHYLLLGICKQVRAGKIPPDQVALLNCEKTRYGTKVKRLPLDGSGRIEGWIPSFAEVDDYLFEDWIHALGEGGT